MKPLKLVAVSAGLSQRSSTRLLADRLANATGRHLTENGREAEIQAIELRELAIDIATSLTTGFSGAPLRAAAETVACADALIVATPIFIGSYSGLLKSFFDVIDNTGLSGKPVLIAASGGTIRHSLALEYALRPIFIHLRAFVVPTAVYVTSEDWGSPDSGPAPGLAKRIDRAAGELADALRESPRGPEA